MRTSQASGTHFFPWSLPHPANRLAQPPTPLLRNLPILDFIAFASWSLGDWEFRRFSPPNLQATKVKKLCGQKRADSLYLIYIYSTRYEINQIYGFDSCVIFTIKIIKCQNDFRIIISNHFQRSKFLRQFFL